MQISSTPTAWPAPTTRECQAEASHRGAGGEFAALMATPSTAAGVGETAGNGAERAPEDEASDADARQGRSAGIDPAGDTGAAEAAPDRTEVTMDAEPGRATPAPVPALVPVPVPVPAGMQTRQDSGNAGPAQAVPGGHARIDGAFAMHVNTAPADAPGDAAPGSAAATPAGASQPAQKPLPAAAMRLTGAPDDGAKSAAQQERRVVQPAGEGTVTSATGSLDRSAAHDRATGEGPRESPGTRFAPSAPDPVAWSGSRPFGNDNRGADMPAPKGAPARDSAFRRAGSEAGPLAISIETKGTRTDPALRNTSGAMALPTDPIAVSNTAGNTPPEASRLSPRALPAPPVGAGLTAAVGAGAVQDTVAISGRGKPSTRSGQMHPDEAGLAQRLVSGGPDTVVQGPLRPPAADGASRGMAQQLMASEPERSVALVSADLQPPADRGGSGLGGETAPAAVSGASTALAQTQPTLAPPAGPQAAADIARQIAGAVQTATAGTIELSLAPEELGRVRMVFHPGEGNLHLVITAERADTQDLLRRHIDLLQARLSELGYASVSFSFDGNGKPQHEHETGPADPASPSDTPPTRADRHSAGVAGALDLRL